ncbi:MAG: hypothetical protein ACI9V1_000526 [Spirosomataceae bacterium]|jgi:hypothetical protein
MKKKNSQTMRILHRYLGFFLAGIMAVYSISGVVLIFRKTDFLKQEVKYEKRLEKSISADNLGEALGMKDLAPTTEGTILRFQNGEYNNVTGLATYTKKELPMVLNKMTHLHKATTNDPLYWLNIFFGFSLLFFVISSFWMFLPGSKILRKGLYFTFGGIVLTLILLFI